MPQDEYEKSMNHYVELSEIYGWRLQVWHRVQEIDGMPGFAGFKADFLERVKQ
jgi:hypothetical protein